MRAGRKGVGVSGRVVVVGGANTDIVGHSTAPLLARDSNPGAVRVSSGGVGRNIAENLARLGVQVDLVTALGDDANAAELALACRRAGIGIDAAVTVAGVPGSVYLAILDADGDMALAINDMRALDALTPEALADRAGTIRGANVVVADANVSAEALEWLATRSGVPLLLDPVSAAKAPRAKGILGALTALKCNALEAAALLGGPEPAEASQIEDAAHRLVAAGVGTVYLTAGPRGTCYATTAEVGWVQAPEVEVRNATGAGDAFSAGVAAGMLEGFSARRCAMLGSVLAGLALASDSTVSDRVDPGSLAAVKEMTL